MIPRTCSRDGSPLRLDTEHAALVAREDQPSAWPQMWRCTASGHTVLDRAPEPYRPMELRTGLRVRRLEANRANGRKGGAVIRRLKAAGTFYRPRRCKDCGVIFQPTSGNQRCPECRMV